MSVNVSVAGSSTEITVSGGIGPKGEDGAAGVSSVNGLTGAVTLAAVGASVAQAGQTITLTVTPGATTWDDLTGKPATFPPSSHTHVIADVTGLQTALDAKAAANHTHTASAITDFSDAALAAVTWTTLTGKPTFAAVATSGAYSDLSGTPSPYTLPTATASVLGGVKIGSGISIDGDGVISASAGYTLPVATASVLGGVKIGSGVSVDGDGVISVTTYTLPAATTSTLGGVIVGTGLSVSTGTVSVSYGTTAGTACQGNDARLSDARTPTSHVHGNITNAGAIGSTSGKIVVTGSSGVLEAATIGSGLTLSGGTLTASGGGNANEIFHPFLLGGM